INRFVESENSFLNYITNTDSTEKNYDEALFYLERINFKTGKYGSETAIAENFITKYPSSPRSLKLLSDLARYYRTAGNHEESIEKYKIIINNPLYSAYADSAALLIADTYAAYGKHDRAADFLKQTIYESSDSLKTQKMYHKLGILNEDWEHFAEAIAWYDSSLTINISRDISVKSLFGIGRIYKNSNHWFEATKTYERLINEFSDSTKRFISK
ncbi:tetratricopeptide repeat protein, partial [Candidatus Latescibacterota bacterium]